MTVKLQSVFYICMLAACITHAQSPPARLIVRGDDMGFSHSGNEALIKTYKEGIERSIEVIVPSPWFPEAVTLLKQNSGVDIGIHLTLSSEWESIKWRPLTYSPSLTDKDGYFYPMIFPNKNYPGRSLKDNKWKLQEIENEFRAQIETAIRKLPSISHISTHMGCNNLDTSVNSLIKKLARQYNIDIDPAEYGVESISYKGPATTAAEKLSSFLKMIDTLQPGKTYLFVDHPALAGPELQAIYHIGYENVAADRQGVTYVWTHPQVKEALRKKNIQLISYADLKKK